jgi:hypothetical protein
MATGTKKVGGAAAAASKGATDAAKTKTKKAKRTTFDVKTAVDAQGNSLVNGDNKLTGVPANFDPKTHKPLKAKMFADEAAGMEFKASQYEAKAAIFKLNADKLREDAKKFREFGDPEKRKSIKKLEKTAEQLLAIQESLAGEGADVDIESLEALLAKVKGRRAAKKAAEATPAA